MKVKYFIIIVLLAFLLVSIVVSCPSALAEIRYAREGYDQFEYQREVRRQHEAYFEELTEYCREHEDIYMEISEEIFRYLDEGLSKDEARETVKNNATMEQKEILEEYPLRYPSNTNDIVSYYVGLIDEGLYYGSEDIKIVYIHKYSEELEEKIMSVEYTTTEKVSDHLYVSYTEFPYV